MSAPLDSLPTVSVVMVSWRTGPALWEAIAAVLDAPGAHELILVDNGNPPEVRARLRELAAARGDMTVVEGQGNVGFATGCNLGARAARGDLLLFLNPDAAPAPGAIPLMAQAGAAAARPWVVGARLMNPDGTEQRGARRGALTPLSAAVSYSGLSPLAARIPGLRGAEAFRDVHRESEPLPEGPAPMPVVSGAAMMIRADDFAALGGFDEAYFLHVEDIDLCRRVTEAGGTVLFQPQALVMHRGSTSQTSLVRVEWAKSKGFVHYFWKFAHGVPGKIQAVLVAPLAVAAIMVRALAYSACNRLGRRSPPPPEGGAGPQHSGAQDSAPCAGGLHARRGARTTRSRVRPLE